MESSNQLGVTHLLSGTRVLVDSYVIVAGTLIEAAGLSSLALATRFDDPVLAS